MFAVELATFQLQMSQQHATTKSMLPSWNVIPGSQSYSQQSWTTTREDVNIAVYKKQTWTCTTGKREQ
jgi:hypothetical protein